MIENIDSIVEQCNEKLNGLLSGLSEDEKKAVENARISILECINSHGDNGWVALSVILSDTE